VHSYLRMLRMIRPYMPQVVMSVLFTLVFSVLSSFSIMIIEPFLRTVFTEGEPVPFSQAAGLAGPERPADFRMGGGDAAGDTTVAIARGAADDTAAAGGGETAGDLEAHLARNLSALGRLKAEIMDRLDDFLLRTNKSATIWRIVVVFFFIYLIKNVAGYVSSVLMAYVGQKVIQDLRDSLFGKLVRLPLAFFHGHRAGELISRVTNDVQIANKCVDVSFTNLVRDPILIVAYFLMALIISWRLTLLACLILPLTLFVIIRIGKKLRRYSHLQQERLADLTSVLQETVYGVRVVKGFAMEHFANQRFLRESQRLFQDVFRIVRMERLGTPLTEQLSVMAGLFILWYGGNRVLAGEELTPGMFILFFIAIFSMVHPIKELSTVNNAIQEGMAAAERIFMVLDTEVESPDGEGHEELQGVTGGVTFESVTFGYSPGEPVLRDISLHVDPGEVVALVGPSGAGKSTLVDLIPRFYDPQQGQVLIDGRDLRRFRLDSLRRSLGIVTQEVILFNDTVANNIAYGLTDVPRERIEAAARAANAHRFVTRLPDGYDTLIGDRGVKLSGGERQRLSIARAILKNPPILIFDEATSALDTESEQLVQEAIDRLVRDRTTFVIAHRLSTITNADRIYVLQGGRIVQAGSHRELLEVGGLYRDLYELQFNI
jgi:subfamily B ATP-binding cassette protein MsbA